MFITFEGGEGTGKSTQISLLKDYLESKGLKVITTREPGGVESAEKIREVILNNEVDGMTEALLYAAARREHLIEKVIPALQDGVIVICDRFIDSSLAYQGVARGLGFDDVMYLNKFTIKNWLPDLTILFELDPSIGLERIAKNRTDEINRFDKEDLQFHLKVNEGYIRVKESFPDRVKCIDASKSIEKVQHQIRDLIDKLL